MEGEKMSRDGIKKAIQYYIDSNGCWICTSHAKSKSGYPITAVNRVSTTIVRYLAKLKYPDLPSYIHVLHKCNNPECINPTHLELGTHTDNMHYRKECGRYADASKANNNNSKLSNEEILAIREAYKTIKTTHRKLAYLFGVSKTQITRILSNTQWKDGD
jgi:hypothetical protein